MNALFATNFATLDWIIVAAYLSVTVLIGIVANRFIHNVSNYMVGGRSVGAALNSATYMGTLTALSVVMYSGLDGFTRGFSYMMVPLIAMLGVLVCGSTGFVVKHLRQLDLTTIPEYFEVRVYWPSGATQSLRDLPVDTYIAIGETTP